MNAMRSNHKIALASFTLGLASELITSFNYKKDNSGTIIRFTNGYGIGYGTIIAIVAIVI